MENRKWKMMNYKPLADRKDLEEEKSQEASRELPNEK